METFSVPFNRKREKSLNPIYQRFFSFSIHSVFEVVLHFKIHNLIETNGCIVNERDEIQFKASWTIYLFEEALFLLANSKK